MVGIGGSLEFKLQYILNYMYIYIYIFICVCVPMGKPVLRTSENYAGILEYLVISQQNCICSTKTYECYILRYILLCTYMRVYIYIGVYTYTGSYGKTST